MAVDAKRHPLGVDYVMSRLVIKIVSGDAGNNRKSGLLQSGTKDWRHDPAANLRKGFKA